MGLRYSTISVREMEVNEIETFLDIMEQNELHFAQREVVEELLKDRLNTFLVAVLNTGQIVGTCFSGRFCDGSGLIAELTVERDNPDEEIIFEKLFFPATLLLKNAGYDLNLPSRFCGRIDESLLPFTKYWTFYLYSARTDEVKWGDVSTTTPYVIEPIDELCQESVTVHYASQQEPNRTVKYTSPLLPNIEFSCKLLLEGKTVGYGVLSRLSEDKWLIGPVIADNIDAAKHIMDFILLNASCFLEGRVFLYTLGNTNFKEYLNNAGFVESLRTWTRYRSEKILENDPFEMIYNNCDDVIYAMGSMLLYRI